MGPEPGPASGPVEPERRGFVDVNGQMTFMTFMTFMATVGAMLIDRMHATQVLAITGATLCLIFLFAVIVLA